METNKSVYLQLFGNYPINRVLDFLITYEGFDYPMVEIAEKSGVGYATLKQFWPYLERASIVVQTRKIGNAKLYKLNLQNPAVKKFRDFYRSVTKQYVHAELEKEGLISKHRIGIRKKMPRKTI